MWRPRPLGAATSATSLAAARCREQDAREIWEARRGDLGNVALGSDALVGAGCAVIP